ncbi:hypothetical protein PybrP1_010757 [[Pythium] brassicae (nom. inval.)]|nr:hypothetical protein PybrP1_010757 [[Pythium] brassicae (nom. inval.)]
MARYSSGDLDIDDELRFDNDTLGGGAQYSPSLVTSSVMLNTPRGNNSTFSTEIDEADYYVNLVGPSAGVAGAGRAPPLYSQFSYDERHEPDPRGSFENSQQQQPLRSSFDYSQPRISVTSESGALAAAPGSGGLQATRSSNLMDRDIAAISVSPSGKKERASDYKGRYRVWPGFLLFLAILGGAAFAITYFALDKRDASVARQAEWQSHQFKDKQIKSNSSAGGGASSADLVEDDGVLGNPKAYPPSACELPDYQSKNGRIVAVSKNGTEVALGIKGVNWFGMETGQAVPFGLWDNSMNGTTAYQVATFLANNKFNAVRLPLMVAWILDNKIPNGDLVNKQENRAVSIKNYMSLLKSIIKVLQFRKIGVLLSMHTLEYNDNGVLWYNDNISEAKFLSAIDVLTSNLCSGEYWNIMGVDLKNEPYKGTWGDDSATDFRAGAQRIANRMLKGCTNWLGFVEGVNGQRTVSIGGEKFEYYDWYGGGLQGAKTAGVDFAVPNKVVYAPHYYTPAVYPQRYFFGAGTSTASGPLKGYTELDDATLRLRVQATMDDMFGFLASTTGPALLLGEFGGLYAKDEHPMKTTKRCTDFTVEVIKKPGWSGGFMWSLNPESAYQYNPADKPGHYTEGLLEDDWLRANDKFLVAMAALDDLPNLHPFPCFRNTTA